mmetsp:Transcript_7753/g.19125  ORF Transcript_7753/g.19125 Transcript_7753/m.19125 type:complete len:293 (+) Transcript_7753:417-1295(+)
MPHIRPSDGRASQHTRPAGHKAGAQQRRVLLRPRAAAGGAGARRALARRAVRPAVRGERRGRARGGGDEHPAGPSALQPRAAARRRDERPRRGGRRDRLLPRPRAGARALRHPGAAVGRRTPRRRLVRRVVQPARAHGAGARRGRAASRRRAAGRRDDQAAARREGARQQEAPGRGGARAGLGDRKVLPRQEGAPQHAAALAATRGDGGLSAGLTAEDELWRGAAADCRRLTSDDAFLGPERSACRSGGQLSDCVLPQPAPGYSCRRHAAYCVRKLGVFCRKPANSRPLCHS